MHVTIPKTGLPVEDVLPELLDHLSKQNVAVLQAPPGAGKTTTVPLWLLQLQSLENRKIIMLEPRRLAARAAAVRMAGLLGEAVGQTVGYRIRYENKVSSQTRIEVVTEGILTRKLQSDPELSDTAVVIFDEFHERSLNSDLGLALMRQTQEFLREDLKVLVMSATLDAEGIAKLLGNAPIVTSQGKLFPVETRYIERTPKGRYEGILSNWITDILHEEPSGDMLVFLPGAGEINRVSSNLSAKSELADFAIHTLFGNLSQKQQDKALSPDPKGRRKIVLATDIAETSLTIDGVRIVVDTGLSRKPFFDPNSGMSRLELKRISRASADQRRGRAGRQQAGVCYRMWSAAEDRGLIPYSEPEIAVADLSSLALELAKWGVTDVSELAWLTEPPEGLLSQGREVLRSLGALDKTDKITKLGSRIVNLPLHPRLASMIVKCEFSDDLALACDMAALLSERDILPKNRDGSNADLRKRLQLLENARSQSARNPALGAVLKNSADIRKRFRVNSDQLVNLSNAGLVLSLAYPDRIGEKRKGKSVSYRLSGGRGAALAERDELAGEPYLVVADLDGKGRDATIRLLRP
ncbi:ATP-dependent helicase HrpB [Sneathiella glossodoripedis]|uniref:ATP-dependent helicase HrpB n=1 Tax=Sneathiella glossodoripedis TaxID=418853 RepID=UPI000685D4FA|nr:ATP-dependent helicase HrpB [Sneathiella glossodoripedis]